MPLFLSHVAVKIRGLCSVYIVYGAKCHPTLAEIKKQQVITLRDQGNTSCIIYATFYSVFTDKRSRSTTNQSTTRRHLRISFDVGTQLSTKWLQKFFERWKSNNSSDSSDKEGRSHFDLLHRSFVEHHQSSGAPELDEVFPLRMQTLSRSDRIGNLLQRIALL